MLQRLGRRWIATSSLREAARSAATVTRLDLERSEELMCTNLMCEHVGERCACKLALWFEQRELPALERLSLAANDLRFIPAKVLALPKLTHLDLSRNMLESVPEAVSALTSLEHIWLEGNDIEDLPKELFDLPNLTTISIKGNAADLSAPPGDARWSVEPISGVIVRS